MEDDKSKAFFRLREFSRELLTVVAGIVIALGLGQVVEALHWRDNVAEARQSLNHELEASSRFYEFRLAANECVAKRLTELNTIAEDAAARRRTGPVGDLSLHLGSLLADDVWQSERSAQTLVHFPRDELGRYSYAYSQQIDLRAWLNRELEVWAGLRLLEGDPNRLSPSDLTLVRNNIQVARGLNFLIVLNARLELKNAATLGVRKTEADVADVHRACEPLLRAAPTRPYTTY